MILSVAPAIDEAIQKFDRNAAPLDINDVHQALIEARQALRTVNEPEGDGTWPELLAFSLIGTREGSSPWGTYFGPAGSGRDKDGNITFYPDIAGSDARTIIHWRTRAVNARHPIIRARYADLAWDLCLVLGVEKRDPGMARLAIDAYLGSIEEAVHLNMQDRFDAVIRALDLAVQIRDTDRTTAARLKLLALHRDTIASTDQLWWFAFDRLINEKRAGVTDIERQILVDDLEALVLRYGDRSRPDEFDPHALQAVTERLTRHYQRKGMLDDVRRLHLIVGQCFEHFASLGNAMLASTVLQTAVNSYRLAGRSKEAERTRILMQEKLRQSADEMRPVETEISISRDDMERFLETIVRKNKWDTFARIAAEFLPRRRNMEDQVHEVAKSAPLSSSIEKSVIFDNHVAAKIGSVDDDLFGRTIHQTMLMANVSCIWLSEALRSAIEAHKLVPEHFVAWANRLQIFDDVTYLIEGVTAWYVGDHTKALHVLTPQIEAGLRGIAGKIGAPTTKPHPTINDASVAIGMGDIVYDRSLRDALGPDLTLLFLALYADPRGMNLRNRVAHGLLKSSSADAQTANLLIHTLLVFGIWKEISEVRR